MISLLQSAFLFLILIVPAFSKAEGAIQNPLTNTGTLEGLIAAFMAAIVQVGAIFLVLALVYVGFLFAQAQGKEDKIKQARNALMWTVVGGIVLLGASAIAEIVKNTAEQL